MPEKPFVCKCCTPPRSLIRREDFGVGICPVTKKTYKLEGEELVDTGKTFDELREEHKDPAAPPSTTQLFEQAESQERQQNPDSGRRVQTKPDAKRSGGKKPDINPDEEIDLSNQKFYKPNGDCR